MNDATLYLITIGAVIAAIIAIYYSIKKVNEKNNQLLAEEEAMRNKIKVMEMDAKQRIEQMEQSANSRVLAAENELRRKELDLAERLEKFNREQQVREQFDGKSDREVVVEMHVKTMKIFDEICAIENKIAIMQDLPNKLELMKSTLTNALTNVSLQCSVSNDRLQRQVEDALSNMSSNVRGIMSNSSSEIDVDDIKQAVSDAISYDGITQLSIDNAVRSAISSEVGYKIDSIESTVNNIESTLSNIDMRIGY